MRATRVYIASPFTKGNTAENIRKVVFAAEQLVAQGYSPFLPHTTTHLWQIINPHPLEYWYQYDNAWLLTCDAVLRLEGESVGADDEVALALVRGIPVFHSIEELIAERSEFTAENQDAEEISEASA